MLQPRVTPDAAGGRRGLALPAHLLRPVRASIPTPPRSRTSTRICSARARYTGKGIYDVDAFEAALAGPRAREHAAQPRSVRGHLRARRARHRRRALRGLPVALRRRRRGASIAGRAATGSCCRGSSARGPRAPIPVIGRWKMLDNLRRTLSAPAAGPARCVAGWPLPVGSPAVWTDVHRSRHRARRRCCRSCTGSCRAARHLEAQPRARGGRRPRDRRPAQVGAHADAARAPGLPDGRRDRPHARRGCSSRGATCSNG